MNNATRTLPMLLNVMRGSVALLLCGSAPAQTGTVAGLVSTTPTGTVKVPAQTTSAPVVPARSYKFTVPKNGGTIQLDFSAQTLAPVTIPAQTLPVTSVPKTYKFSCTAPLVNGVADLSNLTCVAQ